MRYPLQCESTQDVIKTDERSAGPSVVRKNFWIGLVCLIAALSFTVFEASAQNKKITVKFAGDGSGKVTLTDESVPPNEFVCESDCTEIFPNGATVTLTAAPDSGSSFSGWQGGGCDQETEVDCSVILIEDDTTTAQFSKQSGQGFTLKISKAGMGSGTVTTSDNKIDCGSTCLASYDSGAPATLLASPDANSDFTGWSGGGCSGTSNCTTTMDSDKTVTATFAPKAQTFSLTVSKAGTGDGTVTSNEATPLIDCGTTCSADYASGASVTLKATPDGNSNFTGWSGACTGTGDCSLTIDAAKQVTATFAPKAQT
ncbi:hypothetical protein HY009_09465, partial [Candidatus Acetothermia bacterium]|nr:hypothetical protein [Candidatus Acetothermia bacterium]